MLSKLYICCICGIKEPFAKSVKCYSEPLVKDILVEQLKDLDPYHEWIECKDPNLYFGYGELNVK